VAPAAAPSDEARSGTGEVAGGGATVEGLLPVASGVKARATSGGED